MNNSKDTDQFTKKELLHECWEEQRHEINYRRDREQLVFQTSATVWVGLIGAILVNGQAENPFLRDAGIVVKGLFSATVLIAAFMINGWIKKQREVRIRHQQALAEIQKQSGCFEEDKLGETVLPKQFYKNWANPSRGLPDTTKRESHKHLWMLFSKNVSFKHRWSWMLPIIVIVVIWIPNRNNHPAHINGFSSNLQKKPTTTIPQISTP